MTVIAKYLVLVAGAVAIVIVAVGGLDFLKLAVLVSSLMVSVGVGGAIGWLLAETRHLRRRVDQLEGGRNP